MSFSTSLKVFQLNILRQAGITIRPEQVGLKSDPVADLQAKNSTSGFNQLLNQISFGQNGNGLTAPVPPVPPTDLSNQADVAQYQQDVLAYQNNFQVYHQGMLQVMMRQFQLLQQSVVNANKQTTSTSDNNSDTVELGIGGIL